MSLRKMHKLVVYREEWHLENCEDDSDEDCDDDSDDGDDGDEIVCNNLN